MSWLSSWLNPPNPADSAKPYLDQIPGQMHEQLDPYTQAGTNALDNLGPQYEQLMNDPTAFINQIMSGYKPSEGYQAKQKQMLGQASNTAAAGGFSGTGNDVYNQSSIVNDLMSQDQQQYFDNVTNAYNTGLQGEKGIFDTGARAADSLAGGLSNALSSEGSLAFQGQTENNQRHADVMKMLTEMFSAAAGAPSGGKGSASMGSKALTGLGFL